MTTQHIQYIGIGLLAFGWSFIFKLFWNELREIRKLMTNAGKDITKIYERLEGQGAQIRDLKRTKR